MTKDNKNVYRMQLGPVVAQLVETLPDQTPKALDSAVQKLLEDKGRLEVYEKVNVGSTVDIAPLEARLERVSQTTVETGELLKILTELTDHRTRELAKMFLHISTMVGVRMTEEGEERDRLHRRFNEMFHDLEKQMTALSNLLKERQARHDKSIDALKQSISEPRLTIVEKQPAKERGMER